MKKLALVTMVMASIGFTGAVSAKIADSREESLVKVCEALSSDKPIRLKSAMKKASVSFKQVNEGLVCNGENAINFALSHDADKTANLVARKTNQDLGNLVAKI